MTKGRKGEGRGLEAFEVALIKAMDARKMPRDAIMSYFVRPARVISPAAIDEIRKGKIGPNVPAVSEEELTGYIEGRLNEPPPRSNAAFFAPDSAFQMRAILLEWLKPQLHFENTSIEAKVEIPTEKLGIAKIVKSIGAFANCSGGYIFFGITDDRAVVGVQMTLPERKAWKSLGDKVKTILAPSIVWERVVFRLYDKIIAAIYVAESQSKPVISTVDFTDAICPGEIYYRYSGQSAKIEAGDLLKMLAERDLAVAQRFASNEHWFDP